MTTAIFLILSTYIYVNSIAEKVSLQKQTEMRDTPKYWSSVIGDICQLPSIARPTSDPYKYLECVQQDENVGKRTDLGLWTIRECPQKFQFFATLRSCINVERLMKELVCRISNSTGSDDCKDFDLMNESVAVVKNLTISKDCECKDGQDNCVCPWHETVEIIPIEKNINNSLNKSSAKMRKKRQAACSSQGCTGTSQGNYPSSNGCQYPVNSVPSSCSNPQNQQPVTLHTCPLVEGQGSQNARYQGLCSWMTDPLVADPESQSHFLQCQPVSNSLYCGRWQRMPCEPGLIFNPYVQVCVWNKGKDPNSFDPSDPSDPADPLSGFNTPIPVIQPQQGADSSCGCVDGVPVDVCGSNSQCPGRSTCETNNNQNDQCSVCCYPNQGGP